MKIFILSLIITFFCFLGVAQDVNLESDQDILQSIKPAIVSIVTKNSEGKKYLGIGFVVAENGAVITNYSVIKDAENLSIEFKGGIIYPAAGVINYNLEGDLFLLKINASGLPAVNQAEASSLEAGDNIYYLTRTSDSEYNFSSGIFSGIRKHQGLNWLQFITSTSPVNIGSPLINSEGKVIGIVTTVAEGCQELNLAISLEHIKPYVNNKAKLDFSAFKEMIVESNSYFDIGKKHYFNRNYQEAIDKIEKFIALRSGNDIAYNLLGLSYFQIKNYNQAINNYKKALEINPESISVYNNLAIVYLNRGQPQKAISSYKKILSINPNSSEAWRKLGLVYIDLKDYQKAIACYKKILEIVPNNTSVYNDLGWIYGVINDYQKSIEYFKKYSKHNPSDPEIYFKLGLVYLEAKNYAQAKEKFLIAKFLAKEQGRIKLLQNIEKALVKIEE